MSLVLIAALALSPAVNTMSASQCSWDRPGVDPFMGRVPAAVDRYTDIPEDVRARLKLRMAKRQYDEIATIRRDSITGRQRYRPEIRDMHFGQGRVCNSVSRSKWAADTVERGLVYCEAEHCIIVPTVCRNVSRVTRLPGAGAAARGGEPGLPGTVFAGPELVPAASEGDARPLAAADIADPGELVFDAPGAGNSFSEASDPLAFMPPLAGQGAGGVPLTTALGALPELTGPGPGGVTGGGSGLEVPAGVLPLGGGAVGGGGVPPPPIQLPEPMPPIPGVPEPSTWLMWLGGLLGIAGLARRRRRFR